MKEITNGIIFFSAPLNPSDLRSKSQNETSITLGWSEVDKNSTYIFLFNGSERSFTAEDGAVTNTVSSLKAGSKYTFTVFSVFENVRSSGASLTAVTGKKLIHFMEITLS